MGGEQKMEEDRTVILDFSVQMRGNIRSGIDRMACLIRKEYVEFLGGVFLKDENNLDWWVMDFASRNTLASPLFRHCCSLALVQDYLDRGFTVREIRVDSRRLARTIELFFRSRKDVPPEIICTEKRADFGILLRRGVLFLYSCFLMLKQFVWAKLTRDDGSSIPDTPLTLIDTFVLADSFPGGIFKDRYYGPLLDFAGDEEKENIFYLGTYHGIRNYRRMFKDMRRSHPRFLIREDLLTLSDLFSAFLYPLRAFRLRSEGTVFRGFDLRSMITMEIRESAISSASMTGLLNYRFVQRLSQRGIELKRVINWFENQVIDHGLNKGLTEFYPDTEHIGYLGFPLSLNYLGPYPTEQEQRCGLIPDTLAVMGRGYVKAVQVFADNLKVIVAPALRYGNVWSDSGVSSGPDSNTEAGKTGVLIALPYFLEESTRILNMVDSALERMGAPELMVYAKLHPTVTEEKMERHNGKPLPARFRFVTGKFAYWLDRADLIVSSSSTTTLEAIAKGKPVAVIAPLDGLTQLFIPEEVPEEIWRLCYDVDDLVKFLECFTNIDRNTKDRFLAIGRKVREDYFEPISREGARRLLGL